MYSAPAGVRPAGADRVHPTDAILPNGRVAAPAGTSLYVGTGPLGLTLTPDGRFAVLANSGTILGGAASPATDGLVAGDSLSVVDANSMRLVSSYQSAGASFFMGVAAARDPADPSRTIVLASDAAAGAVRILDLDAGGTLTPERTINLPESNGLRAFPGQLSVTPDGRTAYVSDNLGDTVDEIDLGRRIVARAIPVGDFPLYLASGTGVVLASDSGLSEYAALNPPQAEPRFVAPSVDASKASSLSVLELSGGNVVDPATVHMDQAPNGSAIIGGAAPGPAVIARDGRSAYVALSNIDRIAVVSLSGTPHVERGLDLRLYPGAPYGADPSAEVLSPDQKRLYVALAGLNAVAVLDARRPTRYRFGLIPTAWYPTALSISSNGRYLYVASAKGVDGWGILQRVDLKHTSLVKTTLETLRYNRTPHVAAFNPVVPPLRSGKRSEVIDHVAYIAVGAGGYDAILGDLKDAAGNPHGAGDPQLTTYPQSVTPNLHALAATYSLADNFYAGGADADVARSFSTASEATLYQQMLDAAGAARAGMTDHGDDPEDYSRNGYIFNALQRSGLSYRDYGGLLRVSGYDGSLYHLDVPALAALAGNVDLDYAGSNPKVSDMARADEFARDMQQYVSADREPNFMYVDLPAANGADGVAAADRALGSIVEYLSHTPHWSSTAIFVVPESVESPADHVNAMRSYAIVVSPLAKRGYVGDEHLDVASIVKTEEEILGLQPLALNDLLASDLSDFFTNAPVPQAYQAR